MTRKTKSKSEPSELPELLSTKEAAAFLRLSPITLSHYRTQGRGPQYRKHGWRIFYPKPALIAWSERHAYAWTSELINKNK